MRIDLLDVVRGLVETEVDCPVLPTMADSRLYPEAVVLTFGTPERQVGYYDMTETTPCRITVIAKRTAELDAMADAMAAERAIRRGPLDSLNGSYAVRRVETSKPRPIPWDEAGKYVWCFDATITIIEAEGA